MTVETLQGVDSWAPVLAQVGELAASIADTDFVPATLRKKPAAIAAAILTGRELGVGPMTALANIYVINGRPGMSAVLMRQLVLAAGHEIRIDTATDSRCVVRGRRRGEEEWTQVTFTADQAKAARINLGAYPEDKLVARATARLARRAFADCLGGMPYLAEEFEELDDGSQTVTIPAARRTAKRASSPLKLASPPPPDPEPVTVPSTAVGTPSVDEPPLDDVTEEGLDEGPPVDDFPETRPTPYVDELLRGETPPPVEDVPAVDDFPDPTVLATPEQIVAVVAGLAELGIRDRDSRLNVTRVLAGLPELKSSKALSKADASAVLDTMARLKIRPDPRADLLRLITLTPPISRRTVVEELGRIEDGETP